MAGAAPSWLLPGRRKWTSRQCGRSGTRGGGGEVGGDEPYRLDRDRSPCRNACDILRGLSSKSGPSEARRLSWLNALVRLLGETGGASGLRFSTEELLVCLRVGLAHLSSSVRAGTLRAIRYALRCEADVVAFNALRLSYLVTRSLDLVSRNEMERVQALRVVRRAVRLCAHRCEASVARALVAVPNASSEERDRMMRPYLAALCELGVLNPPLFVSAGGVSAVTRALMDCQTPRIAESLCGVLLFLLNEPETRLPSKVDLRCLAAPYCDFHYRHSLLDKNRDERDTRFTSSRLALLSVLRSWPGLLHFCDPRNESGLRAIVDVLYLNQLEVRKAVLDLLYELLGLPQPEWTDELSVALAAVDPSDFQDSWRLNEGFVAAEGRSILPHLSAAGPDPTEIHTALLLYCFLEAGLLDALVEVMVTGDTFISVRTTVLLGHALHLIHRLLPPETCDLSPPLPSLLSRASAAHPQALAAVTALQNLSSLLKSRPASNSLFLDHILQTCDPACDTPDAPAKREPVTSDRTDAIDLLNDDDYEIEYAHRKSFGAGTERSSRNESALVKSKSVGARAGDVVHRVAKTRRIFNVFDGTKDSRGLVKCSNVLQTKIAFGWDWTVIRAALADFSWCEEKGPFLERLLAYFTPSSNKFSHADLQQTNPRQAKDQALAALDFVTHLLTVREPEGLTMLTQLFTDIRSKIASVIHGRSAHECLFSPQHMATTMCQMYFLLIGRLCSTQEGLRIFKDTGLFENLSMLSTTTHHTCYVKLIISSLDYKINSYPRQILAQTLSCKLEASRLYATQFLIVLLRARQKGSEMRRYSKPPAETEPPEGDSSSLNGDGADIKHHEECPEMDAWILELLVKQARDDSKEVSHCALAILEEACNVPIYLDKLVSMKPHVKDLGDRGYLLWVRFASTPAGFQTLADAGYVHRQIRYWANQYNYRYTRLVEGDIHDYLTLLHRSEDDRYNRRHGPPRSVSNRGAFLPPHLYAQLVLHSEGVEMLSQNAEISKLLMCVKLGHCSNEREILELKTALWASGHLATSSAGISLLLGDQRDVGHSVFADTVKLAQTCQVYSIRGTAIYILGLMGSSFDGANVLYELGWLCVRHDRHEKWPLIRDENWLTKSESENQLFQNLYNMRSEKSVVDNEFSEHSEKTDASSERSESKFKDWPVMKIDRLLAEDNFEIGENPGPETSDVRPATESSDRPERRLKSQTLPQRFYSTRKHQRSLSESKTVDKFRHDDDERGDDKLTNIAEIPLLNNRLIYPDVWPDSRARNNSESSTSGVSSCDSALGRYVTNDRVLTLSPIPSSSSLSAMKNTMSSRKSEKSRRISLHSYTGSDVTSSPPSQRDMIGYETLRSLSRHRRPVCVDLDVNLVTFYTWNTSNRSLLGSFRSKSKSESKYTRKSLLQYDWKPIVDTPNDPKLSEPEKFIEMSVDRPIVPRIEQNTHKGPCYIGISMPKRLSDIFPNNSRCVGEESLEMNCNPGDNSSVLDFENNYYGDGGGAANKRNDDSNFNSSFSDLSVGNEVKSFSRLQRAKSKDRFIKHDQIACLYCSRTKQQPESKKTLDLREAFFAGMDSPKNAAFRKSPVPADSLAYASLDVSCGSPTSIDSTLSKLSDGGSNVIGEIVKHSERMGNPVLHRNSKQVLLGLKQKYPETFQNVCLYSEICKIMSKSTYRLSARRFLQEMFLDLNFDLFFVESQQILQSKCAELDS